MLLQVVLKTVAPREKCPNTEFFWSVFSHIRTEYQVEKNSGFEHISHSVEVNENISLYYRIFNYQMFILKLRVS